MAIGKNKRISKGKKGGKKKAIDSVAKKEWYNLKAPDMFSTRSFGTTPVNRTSGTKLATDSLKGRVFEVNLADLNGDEDQGHRKIKLICEDTQGRNCLTDFAGMDTTRHYAASLIRKWQSLIEAHVDVKTSDGYSLRLFAIAFTVRRKNQVKSTSYIRSSKARLVRRKMIEVMYQETAKLTLRDFVAKITRNAIERRIANETRWIFPLQNILIRKIKVIKRPKFDLNRLNEMHKEGAREASANVLPESEQAQNILAAEVVES